MQKNIIITGAAGNLGQVVVKELVNEGYHIIAILGPHDKPERMTNDKVERYSLDLSSEAEVEKFFKEIKQKHNEIHGGIMIAGGFAMGGIKDSDGESIKKMYSLNFETAYFMARQLFIHMEKQENGGNIIFVGAKPAFTPSLSKIMLPYALSKSLLFRLAEAINEDTNESGVSASVIVPGTIDTPANRKAMPDADFSKWVSREALAHTMKFIFSETGNNLRENVIKVYNKS
jgi:NAD(P)-dependent dehydrogenase (short-subunit alcohol dehydrogenase family)